MNLGVRIIAFLVACGFAIWRIVAIWLESPEPPPTPMAVGRRHVWIRYQGIFGTPWIDGNWSGWSYSYAENVTHNPPKEIPSVLFPRVGPYSCHDPALLSNHTQLLEDIGIDGIILEWYGRNGTHPVTRESSNFTDVTFQMLLDACAARKLRVTVELASFPGRTQNTVSDALDYFFETYSNHPAILKLKKRPVVFIHEPRSVTGIWKMIRNRNAFFFGGFSVPGDIGVLREDGFDGVYPDSVSDGYRWSSNATQWFFAKGLAQQREMEFVPRIAPGYNDTATMRWRDPRALRSRMGGRYYEGMWALAASLGSKVVLVDSFNDWFKGTEIEPSVSIEGYEQTWDTWTDGADTDGDYYLEVTKRGVSAVSRDER